MKLQNCEIQNKLNNAERRFRQNRIKYDKLVELRKRYKQEDTSSFNQP